MPNLVWDSEWSSWIIQYEDGHEMILPADSEEEAEIMFEYLEDDEGVLHDE
jgi:hypothetical protein